MNGKIFVLAILIATIASVAARNDLILGQNNTNQVLLYQQYHNATGIPGQIVSQNYFFNNTFYNITLFRALDQDMFGTGGFASILQGGIGYRYVTFNLRASAIGRGFSFLVQMYGLF